MVQRDSNWVLREYNEEKWPSVLAKIDALLASGETSLARALTIAVNDLGNRDPDRFIRIMIRGEPITLPMSFAYGGNQSYISSHLRNLTDRNIGAVVELGSGFGRNLFWLWLQGGPRDVPYVAYEYTAAGRACAERLSTLEPALNLVSAPFDFNAPEFAALGDVHGDVLVFTCHSFEQVPEASREVYDALLDLAKPVRCVHFEPIGWQIREESEVVSLHGSSKEHATKHDYNRNLWSLLKQLETEGAIVTEVVEPEFMCINPKNGTSLVQWRSA